LSTVPATPLACVDLGTNTCHLLVATPRAGGVDVILDTCRLVRLGQGVDQDRRLHPAAKARTLQCLVEYAAAARAAGARALHLVATSAMRDAVDGPAFAAQITRETGFEARIISGEDEARLCWRSAARDFGALGRPMLVFDVGGGSTEFMWGRTATATGQMSINVGSVRLTERLLVGDPPTAAQVDAVRAHLADALTAVPALEPGGIVVGLAGTLTTLASASRGLPGHQPRVVHGATLTLPDVRAFLARVAPLSKPARLAIPALEPGREDVIVAGALVVEAVMLAAGAQQVTVGDGGVRWGLWWSLTSPAA
jgi:exopolyphosphatase/guanosine-5'-triphosphate,3'-diphosphate pyrophosphatase